LVFNKTNGFIHHDGIPAADEMLTQLAKQQGWDVFITDNAAVHNQQDLSRFQLVVWNNVSGDVLTVEQRKSMQNWIEQGGGWLGLHASGGDFSYEWDWYVDTLLGAQFIGHTMSPQFQDAQVLVADSNVLLTAHIPKRWTVTQEEWYAFDRNPREQGYEILLTIDESSYITVGEDFFGMRDRMAGEHPLVWRHKQGQGRVFYSAIGHTPATYQIPEYRDLINKSMVWALNAQP